MPCQQDNVYKAEQMLPPTPECGAWGRALTLKQAQQFVDEMRDRWPRWAADFSQVLRVEVFCDKKRKDSVGGFQRDRGCGVVDMALDHMKELILCHETAHVLADARFGSVSHDPWFCRIYLELVYVCMGSSWYCKLKNLFDELDVDYDVVLD